MEEFQMNEIICPECRQAISEELYNDHLMCHQIQNEDLNFTNNINPIPNNDSNYSSNQNQYQNYSNINSNNIPPSSNSNNDSNNNNIASSSNSNNESNNNQNESIFSKVYDIFTSPFKRQNDNNTQINSNNTSNDNNNSKENQGFFSSLFGSNSNINNNNNLELNNNINNGNNTIHRINENNNINNINSNENNNNGINNDNNNDQQEEKGFFQTISNSISNAFNRIGENYNKLKNRINDDIETSYMIRRVFLDNNPVRLMRNNRRIISDYNINDANYILIRVPIQNYNQAPIRNYNDYINAQRLFLPPIIVGERGHIIDINNYNNNLINENDDNSNQLNENEFNQIMQYLPSTIVNEKKEGENKECVVCLAEFEIGESITTLPCLHVFHTECIKSWLKSKNHCPICKFEITLNSIMREN